MIPCQSNVNELELAEVHKYTVLQNNQKSTSDHVDLMHVDRPSNLGAMTSISWSVSCIGGSKSNCSYNRSDQLVSAMVPVEWNDDEVECWWFAVPVKCNIIAGSLLLSFFTSSGRQPYFKMNLGGFGLLQCFLKYGTWFG